MMNEAWHSLAGLGEDHVDVKGPQSTSQDGYPSHRHAAAENTCAILSLGQANSDLKEGRSHRLGPGGWSSLLRVPGSFLKPEQEGDTKCLSYPGP